MGILSMKNSKNEKVIEIIMNLLEKNNQIKLIVKDNGVGVDENKITKLFEPYWNWIIDPAAFRTVVS